MIKLIPQPCVINEISSVCNNPENVQYITDMSIKNPEGYKLEILSDGINITASDERGFFYGNVTLNQIKMQVGDKLPCLNISDEPKFAYRGVMLDCARHMIATEEIKKMIDVAAKLKFNKFHWHLSDDQGFRIELESFPELTKKGSVRNGDNFGSMCRSDKQYSGYYTKAEIKDVIEYCAERKIDVIPEVDFPGHTSAVLHVFPELSCRQEPIEVKTRQGIYKDNLCLGKSEAVNFVKKLLDEICELFPYEVIHIGGDEAPNDYRNECPDCKRAVEENNLKDFNELQCLFANEIKEYLKQKGKKSMVWNDILKGKKLDKDITVQRWLDPKNNALVAANNGFKIIISDFKPYYFDYPYGMYPLRWAYRKNPQAYRTLTPIGESNVVGMETPLWTEFVDNPERLEYLCLPRWFAVAENAWTAQGNKDYKRFKSASKIICEALTKQDYKIAPIRDWDMPIVRRLADTAKFFIAYLSKK